MEFGLKYFTIVGLLTKRIGHEPGKTVWEIKKDLILIFLLETFTFNRADLRRKMKVDNAPCTNIIILRFKILKWHLESNFNSKIY